MARPFTTRYNAGGDLGAARPRSPYRHSPPTQDLNRVQFSVECAPLERVLVPPSGPSTRSACAGQPQGEVTVLVHDLVLRQVTVLAVPDGHTHPEVQHGVGGQLHRGDAEALGLDSFTEQRAERLLVGRTPLKDLRTVGLLKTADL